jgi:hypothetical protein
VGALQRFSNSVRKCAALPAIALQSKSTDGFADETTQHNIISQKEARVMASHPTNKQRRARQKHKKRHARAREEAQLAGLIPMTPEDALKPAPPRELPRDADARLRGPDGQPRGPEGQLRGQLGRGTPGKG